MWRSAKGAATRYLSPGAAGEVSAREVVARYLAALEEAPGQGDRLAAFRVTRKVAQNLGALWQEVAARGWGLALKDRGLAPLAREPADMLAPGVAGVLAGSGGNLEEAVVRTALALVIGPAVQSQDRLKPDQGRDRGRRFGGRHPVGAPGYPRPMAGVLGLDLGYQSDGGIDAEH